MPKVRKNRSYLFDRRKNDSRKKIYYNTDTGKENISPAALCPISKDACTTLAEQPNESILQRKHPNSSLSLLHDLIKEQGFPKWATILSDTSIQLFTVQQQVMSLPRIERTVIVQSNLSWYACVCGRLLHPDDCKNFSDLPKHVSDINSLSSIFERAVSAQLCPGNPDPDCVLLIKHEGGIFKGENKTVVATLDETIDVIVNGCTYQQTIRTKDCDVLCRLSSVGDRTVRCSSCSRFRGHLRVKRSRHLHFDSSSAVADNSHTSYSNINKDELVHRLKNVQKSRKSIRAKYVHLAKKLIKREGVKMSEQYHLLPEIHLRIETCIFLVILHI